MKCKKCGNEFDGNFCPACGTPADDKTVVSQTPVRAKKKHGCLTVVLVVVVVFFILAAIGSQGGSDTASSQTSTSSQSQDVQPSASSDVQATAEAEPAPTATPAVQVSNMQAYLTAVSYIKTMPFSASGLVDQLEYEGFTEAEAQEAVDALDVDWNEQALLDAQQYLETSAFSHTGLIDHWNMRDIPVIRQPMVPTTAALTGWSRPPCARRNT